jgi:glycosyltransferase involved in cell wall biosynthesis
VIPLLAGAYAVFGVILLLNVRYLRGTRRALAPIPTEFPSVSIIIPARNEAVNLRRFLPSVLAQRYPRFDVTVYDDGSEDATPEVLRSLRAPHLRTLRGEGPPAGWVGKVHALYQASRQTRGDVFLFLDADTMLADPDALTRLVRRFRALPPGSVLTGITRLLGGGRVLVSLVPFVIFTYLPLPLVARMRSARLSGMNGQCWMIDRRDYARLEPHYRHRAYEGLADAWLGFRKNVYPFMGERVWTFLPLHLTYLTVFVLAPLVSPWFLVPIFALKWLADRLVRMPLGVTLLAPVTLVLGAALQLDSAVSHWTGRAMWKGRPVARRVVNGA